MSLVDARPKTGKGNRVIASKRPRRSRGGGRDGDGAEEGDDDDEKGQAKGAAGGAHDFEVDVGEGLSDRGVEEVEKGRERGAERDNLGGVSLSLGSCLRGVGVSYEEDAGEAADGDAEGEGFGELAGWVAAFFGHG